MRSLLLCTLVAACVDPSAITTQTAPIIGGAIVTGPTRAVAINNPTGACTGVLMTESKVLTAAHCFLGDVVPAGTTITTTLGGGATETILVHSATHDPTLAHLILDPVDPGPEWAHDLAVVTLASAAKLPVGAREAILDDATSAIGDTVECYGAGEIIDGSSVGVGTMHTLSFAIKGFVDDFVILTGTPAQTLAHGDSGGPCWSTRTGRIVGIVHGVKPTNHDNWLTRPRGASASYIASEAFASSMFDPSSSKTMTTLPAQWRTASLVATLPPARPQPQIVGVTRNGLEIYSGTRNKTTNKIDFVAATPVNLTALPFNVATPEMTFVDVTGDGLTDLVVPTASEVDVLVAAGASAFRFPPPTPTPLGSSGWTPGNVSFGDLDHDGLLPDKGNDYLWIDSTGVWAAIADGTGKFGAGIKRISWALPGPAGPFQLDATPGTDIGVVDDKQIVSYSALGLGNMAIAGLTTPVGVPGTTGWSAFSGFASANKDAFYDWAAIRDQSLVVQLNNGAGQFPDLRPTAIEVGAGWENNSTMVDLNNDGSADWVGVDGKYVYVKPGLGDGRFGRMKVSEHHLGAITIDSLKFADLDGDGFLDLVAFGVPTADTVTVVPFRPASSSTVFVPLSPDTSWEGLIAGMTKVVDWHLPSADMLCTVFTCGSTTGAAGKRNVNGGGLLATMQVSAQGAPRLAVLADGLARNDRWRWTPEYALRTTADLDGDGSDELVFADSHGMVAANQLGDGVGLVVAQVFGTAIGNVALDASAQLASAGDTDHDGRDELLVQGTGGSVLARLSTAGLVAGWALPDTTTSRDDSAAVQQQEQHAYPALAVVPGTHVRAVITGSGDADLYLRFGAAPTLGAFDCRPYTSTANEICDLVVPQGVTTAQLMVVGYTAASFHLDVTYSPAAGVVSPAGDLDRDGYADLVVASAHGWTVYRGSPQGPVPAFTAPAVLGDRLVGNDSGLLVARADGLYRLTAQTTTRVMPWGGIDPTSRILPLGDLVGDGQAEFATIQNGMLAIVRSGPNGPVTLSTTGLPQGASLVAAGELDELPGPDVVVASGSQLAVYGTVGPQLVTRAAGTLGVTPGQQASASVAAPLPRTAGRRALLVQLTSLTPPE